MDVVRTALNLRQTADIELTTLVTIVDRSEIVLRADRQKPRAAKMFLR